MEKKSNELGFFEACQSGDITTAKVLLKLVDPSNLSTVWEGRTCFHVAVIAGDPDLFRELAKNIPVSDLNNIIEKEDKNGDTALHLAVRKNRVDLVKQLVDLNANLCDCANKEGETPLKLAVSLGFKEAVKLLMNRTANALHIVVELNQVKLVQFLIEKNVDLSDLINKPYQPRTNLPDRVNCAANSSDNEGNCATKSELKQNIDGGDQYTKEKGAVGGDKSSKSNDDSPNNQREEPIVLIGDTPLHIAARNKYEHMVNLLLKVRGVNKLCRNIEDKTPYETAREVMEYHEPFRTIRKLANCSGSPRPFMYCAPEVSHKKLLEAKRKVDEAYKARRNAELVVATLVAAMTCAAAFTAPGGFESNKDAKDRGSPNLISLTSFKLFLLFDCVAFFLSLFVCIMWEMSSELTTGDKMLFMTVNSLVVCCSFAFTTYGFMCAVYVMLERKVKIFSWVILGILMALTLWAVLAFIRQSVHFVVTRARFHRLCGVSCFFDDIVERVWTRAERCGLLNLFRSGDDVSRDLITGHVKFSRLSHEQEVSFNHSRSSSPLNPVIYNNSRSSSPFLNPARYNNSSSSAPGL